MSGKKSRFRLTEDEKIIVLSHFFYIICEDIETKEEDIWKKLHTILIHDNPVRFQTCSFQNLRKNVLHQVSLFKTYDSSEATESGKERLQTPWGEIMKNIMTVWGNYENIVEIESAQKSVLGKRKVNVTKNEVDTAKNIRNAALGYLTLDNTLELELDDDPALDETIEEGVETTMFQEESTDLATVNEFKRTQTQPATKSRKKKNGDDFMMKYFIDVKEREIKEAQEKRQHEEKIATEKMALEMKSLEFKMKQFEEEQKDKQLERQRQLEKDRREREDYLAKKEEEQLERKMQREERLMQTKTMQATTSLLNSLVQSDLMSNLLEK